MLISSKTFFGWCTQFDTIDSYRSILQSNIFTCMEMSKQSYGDVISMPVKRFQDYMKWKSDLEDEKQKMLVEGISKT